MLSRGEAAVWASGSKFRCAVAGEAVDVTPSHPPLTFPVYGLAAELDGPRWLDAVIGPIGREADGVWLGHGGEPRDAGRPWVHVGTFRRTPLRVTPADIIDGAADNALFALVNATMPSLSARPAGYGPRLLDAAARRAGAGSQWSHTSWQIDDRTVPAATFYWASAWCGFTTALADVDIVAYGFAAEPNELAFAQVSDGSDYGFDLAEPVTFPDTVDQARASAGVRAPAYHDARWWPPHPDHDVAES